MDQFYKAGITIKVITGDNSPTTSYRYKAGIKCRSLYGRTHDIRCSEMIQAIHETTLFTRMFPEAKLAVINALKRQSNSRWWVMALMMPCSKAAHRSCHGKKEQKLLSRPLT
jgi:magnesium-transporting ATPase (P-type)